MNIEEINQSILELEQGPTTFATCEKLSWLYTVRDHLDQSNVVEKEYSDILPEYQKYKEIKRKYQLNEVSIDVLDESIHKVCLEISEFMKMLYSCTDTENEREQIHNMLVELSGQ